MASWASPALRADHVLEVPIIFRTSLTIHSLLISYPLTHYFASCILLSMPVARQRSSLKHDRTSSFAAHQWLDREEPSPYFWWICLGDPILRILKSKTLLGSRRHQNNDITGTKYIVQFWQPDFCHFLDVNFPLNSFVDQDLNEVSWYCTAY